MCYCLPFFLGFYTFQTYVSHRDRSISENLEDEQHCIISDIGLLCSILEA